MDKMIIGNNLNLKPKTILFNLFHEIWKDKRITIFPFLRPWSFVLLSSLQQGFDQFVSLNHVIFKKKSKWNCKMIFTSHTKSKTYFFFFSYVFLETILVKKKSSKIGLTRYFTKSAVITSQKWNFRRNRFDLQT